MDHLDNVLILGSISSLLQQESLPLKQESLSLANQVMDSTNVAYYTPISLSFVLMHYLKIKKETKSRNLLSF